MDRTASSSPAPADTAASIEREIEALKAFLARYPLPAATDEVQPVEEAKHPAPAGGVAEEPRAPELQRQAYSSPVTENRMQLLGTPRRKVIAGLLLAGILIAAALAGLPFRSSAREGPRMGRLSVTTSPSGMAVVIDGVPRSVTPVTVDLSPGEHVLEVITGSERRRIPVTIAAGSQVSHFLEIAAPSAAPEAPASTHAAAVPTAGTSDSTAAGWVSISAPSDVQVLERGRLLGSSRVERIMLPVGRHELEFVSEALGYRTVQTVDVIAGDVVPIKLRWPQGSVSLNAIPWAEVWVDGQQVGETPIGGLTLPIGVHEVVFRHPELGERRASLTVTMGKTTTLGVDLGAK